MATPLTAFRRVCPQCDRVFYICLGCDRGHWHCGHECSFAARKARLRRARIKYQRSAKGRRSNARAQATYRNKIRQQEKIVSHQSSQALSPQLSQKQQANGGILSIPTTFLLKEIDDAATKPGAARPQCAVCKRVVTSIISEDSMFMRRPISGEELSHDSRPKASG